MNPFKPKRTFESVVRELIAGLEDGTIVLSNESAAPQPEKQNGSLCDQAEQVIPHTAPATSRPGEPFPD
jgi:hypothetical protein